MSGFCSIDQIAFLIDLGLNIKGRVSLSLSLSLSLPPSLVSSSYLQKSKVFFGGLFSNVNIKIEEYLTNYLRFLFFVILCAYCFLYLPLAF